jgi:hypothetical protein
MNLGLSKSQWSRGTGRQTIWPLKSRSSNTVKEWSRSTQQLCVVHWRRPNQPKLTVACPFGLPHHLGALSANPMTIIPANSLLLAFLSVTTQLARVEATRDNDGLEHYNKKNTHDIEVPLAGLRQKVVQKYSNTLNHASRPKQ